MWSILHRPSLGILALALLCGGCWGRPRPTIDMADRGYWCQVAANTAYQPVNCAPAAVSSLPPASMYHAGQTIYWDLTLCEALQMTLHNSTVVRDLGGRVVSSPGSTPTAFDPGIVASHPRSGIDASLSQFDAQFETGLFWDNFDRATNNLRRWPDGVQDQDLVLSQSQLSKRNMLGGEVFLRNNTLFDRTNERNARFPSYWDTNFELGMRQPLLRGAGRTYNAIAGNAENQDFLLSNGVVIARIDTRISQLDFETSLQNLIGDVEDAYWRLSYAYRELEAKVAARNAAEAAMRQAHELMQAGLQGGTLENYSLAQERYFLAQAELENSLSGTASSSGLHANERRLRLLIGLPPNDGRLIRPSDQPCPAEIAFDWQAILTEALARRSEVRRQKLRVERRELQLTASRSFLWPRLDAVALYRQQGYGDGLFGGGAPYGSAFRSLGTGEYSEHSLGLELEVPLGFRQAEAGVRHYQFQLARERAILAEQELQITHDLTAACQEMERALTVAQTLDRRRQAARRNVEASEAAFQVQRLSFDLRLESHRRLADAEAGYHRALVDYAIALKNLHLRKGSLLDYHQICLADARAPQPAACEPQLDYTLDAPPFTPVPQQAQPTELLPNPPTAPPAEANQLPPGELPLMRLDD